MIIRVWHGWTTPENATRYERLLRNEIFPWIHGQKIDGFHGISLLRLDGVGESEFITLMKFDSMNAIRAFAGEDCEMAVVKPEAHALLARYDVRSQHYQVAIPEEDRKT